MVTEWTPSDELLEDPLWGETIQDTSNNLQIIKDANQSSGSQDLVGLLTNHNVLSQIVAQRVDIHNLARAQGTTEGLYHNMAHTDSEVTQDSDKSNVSPQLQMRNSCSNERKQV